MFVTKHSVKFDLNEIMENHLPYLGAFYSDKGEFHQDIHDLFEFPMSRKDAMPFYNISQSACADISEVSEKAYSAMLEALEIAFANKDKYLHYFNCEMLRSDAGPAFVEYAEYTFKERNQTAQALYGRFDMAIDPGTELVKGIYEFNGDTPVMLFESTALNSDLVQQVTESDYPQFNEYYGSMCDTLRDSKVGLNKKYAVVFDGNFVDDSATCEILTELLSEHRTCFMADIRNLDYDHANLIKPFAVEDVVLDGMFILSPWEEMVAAFPTAFLQWKHWAQNVNVMEPAWRWFMSHKGMMALVTELLETNQEYNRAWGALPFLRTYLSPEYLRGIKYVAKPVLGRLSSNIRIVDSTGIIAESGGAYGDTEYVYQAYCAPGVLNEGKNFIAGVWMAPIAAHLGLEATAGTLCFREFDSPILSLQNERFVPHIMTE